LQSHLHWSGTLKNGLIPLAIRLETQLITATQQALRPPRVVALALAFYLWSEAKGRPMPSLSEKEKRGRAHFVERCVACHREDGTTRRPMLAAAVGTDPAIANSSARGTGKYRVPSLYRLSQRKFLLHRGLLKTLDELLSPDRLGRVPGHAYGLDLDAQAKAELIAYLQRL